MKHIFPGFPFQIRSSLYGVWWISYPTYSVTQDISLSKPLKGGNRSSVNATSQRVELCLLELYRLLEIVIFIFCNYTLYSHPSNTGKMWGKQIQGVCIISFIHGDLIFICCSVLVILERDVEPFYPSYTITNFPFYFHPPLFFIPSSILLFNSCFV